MNMALVTALLFGVLSAITTILMRKETNRRLLLEQMESGSGTEMKVQPYCSAAYMQIAVITLLSCYLGYRVGGKAVSVAAAIQLGACYLAVLAAAIIDLKTKTIPNNLTYFMFGVRLIIMVFEYLFLEADHSVFLSSVLAALLMLAALALAKALAKGGMGAGDIKLICGVGFICGLFAALFTLLLAMICCIAVTCLRIASRKSTAKDDIPFGPFIYAGFMLMCLLMMGR